MLYALLESIRENPSPIVDWAYPISYVEKHLHETPVSIAYGDGIGPEIMDATLAILSNAGAKFKPQTIDIGEKVYHHGFASGISPDGWQSLRRPRYS